MFGLIFLMILHGILHCAGIITQKHLSLSLTESNGLPWLITSGLFISSGISYALNFPLWWLTAGLAVVISQGLIIKNWNTAKAGTLINILLLPVIICGYGYWSLKKTDKQKITTLLSRDNHGISSTTSKASLPPVIVRWLTHSGINKEMNIYNLHLTQKGRMRTSPDASWMNMTAEQYFTIDNPGFLWIAQVEMNPWVRLDGRDEYKDGRGHMLIKAYATMPVVNEKGKQIDQGTLLRYMAEMIWFPSAAACSYISWEQVNDSTARATLTYKGVQASGLFSFTPEGDFKKYETLRYYKGAHGYQLEKWLIEAKPGSYKTFEGIRVPTQLNVTWKLKEGDFNWLNLEVMNINYNLP